MSQKSFLSSKAKASFSTIAGQGLFACAPIARGEVIVDYSDGPGQYTSAARFLELYNKGIDLGLQVDDDLFFVAVAPEEIEDVDRINHSCDPNCGFQSALVLVAMKDIAPGEEITFDYAMSETADYQMGCSCGGAHCRKVVNGEDWKRPDLQERYKGYFSPYVQRKIGT